MIYGVCRYRGYQPSACNTHLFFQLTFCLPTLLKIVLITDRLVNLQFTSIIHTYGT